MDFFGQRKTPLVEVYLGGQKVGTLDFEGFQPTAFGFESAVRSFSLRATSSASTLPWAPAKRRSSGLPPWPCSRTDGAFGSFWEPGKPTTPSLDPGGLGASGGLGVWGGGGSPNKALSLGPNKALKANLNAPSPSPPSPDRSPHDWREAP